MQMSLNTILPVLAFLGLSLLFLLVFVLILFYAERKLAAFMQDRIGPLHNGKKGTLQPFADLLKLVRKETIFPDGVHRGLFILAPFLVFAPVLAGFSFLPLWPDLFSISGENAGILLLPAVISVEAVGILMAAWASQSRFPVLGAARAIAQMVSYEIPLGLVLTGMIWIAGSASFRDFEVLQSASGNGGLFPGIRTLGGIFSWNLVQFPLSLLLVPVFFISMLAESNRAPFDIPEGESEIIGGFHTEYSGFLWASFFLAEYAMMLLLSLVFSWLFLGGPNSPLPLIAGAGFLCSPSFFWLAFKSLFLGIIMIWIRWTLPRLRADQLSSLSWKYLSPLAFIVLCVMVIFH
jgi:NADH-quinone oxidoreductase subunit H